MGSAVNLWDHTNATCVYTNWEAYHAQRAVILCTPYTTLRICNKYYRLTVNVILCVYGQRNSRHISHYFIIII